MKIYTVQRMDKIDYDFSVSLIKYGCFASKEKAKRKARLAYEKLLKEYAEEIEEYSNEEYYEEPGDGLLEIEEDEENGYYRISFGFEEDYEMHNIAINEWNLDTTTRDDMLITAGSRAAYLDTYNVIDLPYGVEGEAEVASFIGKVVDKYIETNDDESFDIYIEAALINEYKKEE